MAKSKTAKAPKEPKPKKATEIFDFSTAQNNYGLKNRKEQICTFDMENEEGVLVKVAFLNSEVPDEAWDAMDL